METFPFMGSSAYLSEPTLNDCTVTWCNAYPTGEIGDFTKKKLWIILWCKLDAPSKSHFSYKPECDIFHNACIIYNVAFILNSSHETGCVLQVRTPRRDVDSKKTSALLLENSGNRSGRDQQIHTCEQRGTQQDEINDDNTTTSRRNSRGLMRNVNTCGNTGEQHNINDSSEAK